MSGVNDLQVEHSGTDKKHTKGLLHSMADRDHEAYKQALDWRAGDAERDKDVYENSAIFSKVIDRSRSISLLCFSPMPSACSTREANRASKNDTRTCSQFFLCFETKISSFLCYSYISQFWICDN